MTKDGPEIESVLAYGNSDDENSPHFDDQMDIYLDFKTNTVFVKQGQFFIPYEDYISETISTD